MLVLPAPIWGAYSGVFDSVVCDLAQREYLFNAIETLPCVKRKADWALNWIGNKSAAYGDVPPVGSRQCVVLVDAALTSFCSLVQESAW